MFKCELFKTCHEPSYKTTYGIYFIDRYKKEPEKQEDIKKLKGVLYKNNSCFAHIAMGIKSVIKNKGKYPNRLVYFPDFNKNTENFDKESAIKWLTWCRAEKLLPKYTDAEKIVEKNIFTVKLPKIDSNRLLMYLSVVRYIQEYPSFIKAVVHLVEEMNFDLFAAIAAASQCILVRNVHSIVPGRRKYGPPIDDVSEKQIDITDAIGLKKLIKTGLFKGVILNGKNSGMPVNFRLHDNLKELSIDTSVHFKMEDLCGKKIEV